MRDVTDKQTGELDVGEVKRGRGRPRKPDAMTNAQRQAAYRARHRAPDTVTVGGVTRKAGMRVSELLALADAEVHQEEVDFLQRQLDEARRKIRLAEAERDRAFERNDELRTELAALRAGSPKGRLA